MHRHYYMAPSLYADIVNMDNKADRIARMRRLVATIKKTPDGSYLYRDVEEMKEIIRDLSDIIGRKLYPLDMGDLNLLEQELRTGKQAKEDCNTLLVRLAQEQRHKRYLYGEDDKGESRIDIDVLMAGGYSRGAYQEKHVVSMDGQDIFLCPFCGEVLEPDGSVFLCTKCGTRSNRCEFE